ncbi:MAG: signal peptide peptidase SppA, partial [Pseudomonadota bacterium]
DQGKFVVSFAESFGELGNGTLDYFLASVGDQVWLQPSGDLDLTGFAIESPFAKDLLDMVGVEPEMAEREEFKGVLSGFKHNQMPEPQRQNLQQLLDSWLGQIAAGIAASRDMAPDAVRQAINQAPYGARDGAAQGLIDELGYWDQVTQATLEQVGDDASFLDFFDYHAAVGSSDPTALAEGEVNTIALIYGLGPVTMGASENDPVFGDTVMGSDTVATALSDAIDDPDIAAIVFRVDSPGGSYVASDTIWREVQRAREAEKPVILTMGNLAASGGYFVAAPATKIVAQPGTITGSIGVAAGKFDLSGLWDKLGVHWDVVKAGDNADLWSSTESFTDDGWDHLNASLDRTYADFLNKVAQGRGFNDEEVRQVAKGQVWTGADALNLGLIDALGGFDTAFALARSEAGLATDAPLSIRRFPEPVDPFQALLEEFFLSEISAPLLRPLAGLAESLRPWLSKLEQLSAGGPQPRLQWEPPQEAR